MINEIPTIKLTSFCKTGTGGTPSRALESRYSGGKIPWEKAGELREGIITETEEHLTDAALAETTVKMIPARTMLYVCALIAASIITLLADSSTATAAADKCLNVHARQAGCTR